MQKLKQKRTTLTTTTTTTAVEIKEVKDLEIIENRKIVLATEGFTTNKFCELLLKDRDSLCTSYNNTRLYLVLLYEAQI
jgi:hypothetical protein